MFAPREDMNWNINSAWCSFYVQAVVCNDIFSLEYQIIDSNWIVELWVCPSAVVGAVHVSWNMLAPVQLEISIWIVGLTRYGIQEYFLNFKFTPGPLEISIWIVGQTRHGIQEYFDNFKSEFRMKRRYNFTWAFDLGKGRLQSSPLLNDLALS